MYIFIIRVCSLMHVTMCVSSLLESLIAYSVYSYNLFLTYIFAKILSKGSTVFSKVDGMPYSLLCSQAFSVSIFVSVCLLVLVPF